MMLRLTGSKCVAVTLSLILWFLLANIMLLLYCLKLPSQDGRQDETCLGKNSSGPSRSLRKGACSPVENIMFMKTHKTASSTLLNILFRFGQKHRLKFAFPDGRNDFFYPSPFRRSQVRNYTPGECFNILCNHMRFQPREVAKLLPADAVYVSILRDPAHLFESAFHYYHRAVPFTWRIGAKDKMAAFLDDPWGFYSVDAYNSFYLRNLLSFDFGLDNNLEPDDAGVTASIWDLSTRFHLVLIAEHFEESLVLLKETLCWTTEDILYFKLNARKASAVTRLTPEMRAKALRWNGADWKLYRHFNDTFWAKVEAYGRERMEREVAELRRRNAEMRAACIEGGEAVDAEMIREERFLPWQPVGGKSIVGYNMNKDVDAELRSTCERMLTPEIQYLDHLGVNLWLTRLWGWFKDAIY
ncbi:galactosylceramide sulfotransferase isoform X1 [Entelurus aequoreus]|uniref:galactosylceramide sulfotransferase isoform X1 n=2 Tax=Entelurus aequoreus TaxID=161455 RepID=UPI002B1DCEE0|nr:galactosylceramide sulfotransferase isoform X1 [Entelurus aequoreus]